MLQTYRIGRLFGFPLEVNLSFLLMLGVVLLWMGGLAGLFIVGIAFVSVLMHELGHAVVARRLGVTVAGIELHFFGGAAKMTTQPKSANDEVLIAAAGPAVSFVLGGVGMLIGSLTGIWLVELLGWINLIIGAFNLVPALPMDGGRIFRALLSKKTGYVRATEISIYVARAFAIALGVLGLVTSQLYLILLAGVIWWMGSQELRIARFLGNQYASGGERPRAPGEAEVMPRSFDAASGSQYGRFVIRREGGRTVVQYIE
jgi:Zn-dependent protease